jgi:hypothetical protein
MNRVAIVSALAGVAIGVGLHATTAKASFPAGGARLVSGDACLLVGSSTGECPMLSDGNTYWGGAVGDIYVDFNFTPGHLGYADVFAAREQYDGTAFESEVATTQGSGNQDIYLPGFSGLASPQYGTDLYWVDIYGLDGTINTIYGATFAQ